MDVHFRGTLFYLPGLSKWEEAPPLSSCTCTSLPRTAWAPRVGQACVSPLTKSKGRVLLIPLFHPSVRAAGEVCHEEGNGEGEGGGGRKGVSREGSCKGLEEERGRSAGALGRAKACSTSCTLKAVPSL